jgi:glycosyltransferase involved in cell wall biosynthesis
VIITDSWNFKPRLAEAVRGYPYFLRQQALECLCPLNNLRLLADAGGEVRQCPLHQLAAPEHCRRCVTQRGEQSGSLHQWERELAGVGTDEYQECLSRALHEAEAVLVLNPLAQAMLAPYCRDARVVTWGMDPARFPWPWQPEPQRLSDKRVLFMAGLVQEAIKGFSVLHAACAKLWQKRQDFELFATGDPAGQVDEFTRFVGWQSQADLPRYLRAADIVVMPTIAQEGLGRTTVEAMAVGRPVIASRIGGLPYTVQDSATGLLCEPGDADDLADKIERLLDNSAERDRMGQLGRERFQREFTWERVIERDYRPLLTKRRMAAV